MYIEIADRELDSKILLGSLAASRNHKVLISDLNSIKEGARRKLLSAGIFLDKSLTPNDKKYLLHNSLVKKEFLITSIDEENNLINYGYDNFALDRFSEKTISQSSAVFTWGSEDYDSLKKNYSNHSSKIHMTGSPRIDLLKPLFLDYWAKPNKLISKPYLLISTNFEANDLKPFHEKVVAWRKGGYFDRDPSLFIEKFNLIAEHYQRMATFVEAIQYISNCNTEYDLVVRPHPSENIESWKIFLKDLPNVHVIRDGSVIPWINNSFGLMHNGCTTAIESTIFGKPVITYSPIELKYYTGQIPNKLGHQVKSPKELLKVINHLYEASIKKKNNVNDNDLETISKKIFIDTKQLAAEKIIKEWENLDNNRLSQSTNWIMFEYFLKLIDFKKQIGNFLKKVTSKNQYTKVDNYKFPELDKKDIFQKFDRLKKILKLENKIECKVLSKRSILIKKI